MKTLTINLLLLLSGVTVQIVSSCEIYKFVSSDGPQALQGHVIKTMAVSYVNFCWNDCVWLSWCFSINVRQTSDGTLECELNNSSKIANPSKLVTRQGWSYHEMQSVDEANCKLHNCKRKQDLGDGWFLYNNAAIKLFTDKKNWTDARSHCQSLGGDLLSITDPHENDFIYDIFIKDLNLTYTQEDKGISLKTFQHFKLNGGEPAVKLLGTPGDAVYKQDGREKALYFNGQKGFAELPSVSFSSGDFSISFWMKTSNHTQAWVVPMNIHDQTSPKIVEATIGTSYNDIYYNVKDTAHNTVAVYGGYRLPRNQWTFHTFSWKASQKLMRFGYQGTYYKSKQNKVTEIKLTANEKWALGSKSEAVLNVQRAFHGYLKHVVVTPANSISRHESQTIMYWNEQGVWIGLNALPNNTHFSWSDGTPLSFKTLPVYNGEPALSGRKCAAFGKDRIWLDKHCQLKYPYLCEKPVP